MVPLHIRLTWQISNFGQQGGLQLFIFSGLPLEDLVRRRCETKIGIVIIDMGRWQLLWQMNDKPLFSSSLAGNIAG